MCMCERQPGACTFKQGMYTTGGETFEHYDGMGSNLAVNKPTRENRMAGGPNKIKEQRAGEKPTPTRNTRALHRIIREEERKCS